MVARMHYLIGPWKRGEMVYHVDIYALSEWDPFHKELTAYFKLPSKYGVLMDQSEERHPQSGRVLFWPMSYYLKYGRILQMKWTDAHWRAIGPELAEYLYKVLRFENTKGILKPFRAEIDRRTSLGEW